jgi:transcriptional regulator with GAF, ATPase, and Fis domain
VGVGAVQLLESNAEWIAQRVGSRVVVKAVSDIDWSRPREFTVRKEQQVTQFEQILDDPEIDIVIEAIGGIKVAREVVTGALTRQAGRFEVADGSTIFLDEIAELSLEVQAKLLRVLQEGQFERLGNPRALRVDARIIAATNRNLGEQVRKARFREDLFYRLNVFPIKVPPLRERAEDLPLLVWAFVEEFASSMGKRITKIPRRTMEVLQHYPWPGNVRELRNVLEHGVIISPGEILRVPPLDDPAGTAPPPMTLAEAEREHILEVLELTGWRIKGPRGAAGRLGLKASTLYTRMQKHGIPTRRQKDEAFVETGSANMAQQRAGSGTLKG